ncbi:hypothetical protein ARALYDRAFT_907781 [Arabidopsis lyrata subsp. lyrata]|uniref:F-box domain-containing protein n=1 Tax=Arabidopsis lyrata subsp. lyrata TaxID=81972 RepID=D7LST8_ARALL|nr:hypothetical protein ARALYDRAFT_907781 [Arabidopsis lyrata subsp. lyrata]
MDRISNLPDDIIYHAISFLSAKEATCLKYASKKWLNLVTIIPSAVFVDSSSSASSGSFQDFADRIKLAPLTSHRMRRFSLKLQSLDFAQYETVNDCLRKVLECGVLDLELDINVKGDYSLPFEIFTCQSVVKLKLGSGFVIDILPKNALLPALKTLLLDSVRFEFDNTGGCAFTRLLSACPVLEELIIDGFNCELWNWSHTVYSRILKRLTIRRAYSKDSDDCDDYDFERISFDTPSLTYLEYRDYIHDEFPDVNLNSLVEAKLQFNMWTAWMNTDLTNLFKGLKHVQILRLKFIDTLMDLHHEYREYLDLKSVCECLEGYSFLLSCPVEILTITQFGGRIGEMVQIKHVLEKLQCLVLLEVHVEERRVDNKLQILADLLMLPRASSKCKVQLGVFVGVFVPKTLEFVRERLSYIRSIIAKNSSDIFQ